MASDPWEILQRSRVDVPGLLSAYQQQKQGRLQEMYMKQQMDRQDRADQKQARIDAAYREAYRGHRRVPPSQGSAVSDNLGRLSGAPGIARSVLGDTPGVAALAGVGSPLAAPYAQNAGTGAPAAPTSPPAQPQAPLPPAQPEQPMPDLPKPPVHLLPDVDETDDGVDFSPGLGLNREGLDKLADEDPKAAYGLLQMDDEARARAFKRVSEHVAFVSQVIGAVRSVPEAQRPALYQRIRADLASKGIQGMPEQWSEDEAEARQRMGLTVMQAFQDDRSERRFQQDVADDEADNERADRNTDSLISDRNARRGLVARGQDLTDARGRRGQDIASTDRRRGQDITDHRLRETGGGRGGGRQVVPAPSSGGPAPQPQAGAGGQRFSRTATDPKTGKQVGWNGTRWMPIN